MTREQTAAAGSRTALSNDADAQILPQAPDGFVWRFAPTGRPAMVREADVPEWEAEHGVSSERYDLEEAAANWNAAYAALPDVVVQIVEELAALGYIRADMDAALRASWGALSDAFTYLVKCIANLHPTENQVADAAIAARASGSLEHMPQHYQKRLGHLIDRIPSERIAWHEARSATDNADTISSEDTDEGEVQ